jgi:glutamyl-tRNA synthetase
MKNSLTLPVDEVQRRVDAGDPYTVRMKMPRNKDIRFEDMIRGWVVVNTNNLDDKILLKPGGMPTYHLANIVDDHAMDISHVIRGEEWLPSAPLHGMIYEALGWESPKFAHLPLVLKPNGNGKLSKRDGDQLGFPVFPTNWTTAEGEVFSGYRESGYDSAGFVNMLAFLGWNPGTPQEIFSLEELGQTFTIERVSKSGAKFDPDKTRWFQQQYLRSTSDEALATQLSQILNDKYEIARLTHVCRLMKERATFVADIWTEGSFLLEKPTDFDAKTVSKKWKDDAPMIMAEWQATCAHIEQFEAAVIEESFKAFIASKELGIGAVLPLFRLLLTGKGMGPSMFEIAEFLGKEECTARISEGIEKLASIESQA